MAEPALLGSIHVKGHWMLVVILFLSLANFMFALGSL